MPGKVPPTDLATHVFTRTGATDDSVLQGPALGEDAAAIAIGDETLVVSSDPVSLAASSLGRIAVAVAVNDVAATGADPRWVTVTLLLPPEDDDALETVTRDIDAAATEIGICVVGGHTEYVDALERPLAVLTAFGTAERVVTTGGARPGDALLLTGAAGLEGTAIIAGDFGEDLDLDVDLREEATAYLEEIGVVEAARAVRRYATAMHDPTEGGIAAGAVELALASDVRLEVDRDAVPVRKATEAVCAAAGVDPLFIFGSGAMLVTVGDEDVEDAVAALEAADVTVTEVGTVREASGKPGLVLDGERIESPPEDAIYPLWAGD